MGNVLVYPLTENVGGVEEYVMNLLRYSINGEKKYGYVILGEFCPYQEELQRRNASYYYLPTKKKLLSNIVSTFLLFKRLRKQYEVLYFNTSALGYMVPYFFAIMFGYTIILHSHLDGSKISSKIKILVQKFHYQMIKKNISKKMACSKAAANWMFDGEIEDVIIVPNAIELNRFVYDEKKRYEIRSKLNIENCLVVGNVSRLTLIKNQEFLLRVICECYARNKNVRLVLVGEGEDRDRLEKMASELGIDKIVIFWGRTDKPEEVMNCMDCIVFPSITEGFPISIIEAQAAGLKCLLSDSITKEVNITGDVMYESLENSPQIWANSILNMNHCRSNNIRKLEEAGFNVHHLESFVWQSIGNT